jgi:hypothetical protein
MTRSQIDVTFEVSAVAELRDSAAHRPLRPPATRDALRDRLTLLDVDELIYADNPVQPGMCGRPECSCFDGARKQLGMVIMPYAGSWRW